MTLDDLISIGREEADDTAEPYLWRPYEWIRWFNEAEREACIRARLIQDITSVAASLAVTTTTAVYNLHASVLDVLHIEATLKPKIPVTGWTLTPTQLVLESVPLVADTLKLTVVRMPLAEMVKGEDSPEIGIQHHRNLVNWALYRAYMKKDADSNDAGLSDTYLGLFERDFGERFDANVQGKHREKRPQVVRYNGF